VKYTSYEYREYIFSRQKRIFVETPVVVVVIVVVVVVFSKVGKI